MRTGDLARLFGVSNSTIQNWCKEFSDFVSDSPGRQRGYTEADVLALATIAKLSADGLPYKIIQERLEAGERVDNPSAANFGVDTRMVPAAAVEQIVDATEVRIELENVKNERDRLLADLVSERQRNAEQAAEIKQLNREIGRLEGRLEQIERGTKNEI